MPGASGVLGRADDSIEKESVSRGWLVRVTANLDYVLKPRFGFTHGACGPCIRPKNEVRNDLGGMEGTGAPEYQDKTLSLHREREDPY